MRVRIYEIAEKNGYTITELSKKLNVAVMTLYRWNAGKSFPNRSNIARLKKILNCRDIDLITD